jgi:hypothetical protein
MIDILESKKVILEDGLYLLHFIAVSKYSGFFCGCEASVVKIKDYKQGDMDSVIESLDMYTEDVVIAFIGSTKLKGLEDE